MIRSRTLTRALVAGALVALAPLAMAEEHGAANRDIAASSGNGAVATVALAQSLYAYGLANRDALAVLSAARMMNSVELTDAERKVESSPTEGATPGDAEGAAEAPVDAATMLATARELAGENEALLGLIEDAEAAGSRGRIGGPSRTLSRLNAGYTDVWEVPFHGGALAEVAVLGDGDADLDVIVTDENGNTICYDTSFSDKIYCSWTPLWSGPFYVTVMNVGRVRNSYYLLTN